MIVHAATLDVSVELAQYVAWLLCAERCRRGTRSGTRALTCFWQAVLGLRWFRDRLAPARLGRDHGVSRATSYRYRDEAIAVLDAQAPDVHQVLQHAQEQGLEYVIRDGSVLTSDRCSETTTSVAGYTIDAWYSGKASQHGGNIQALSAPNGLPLWTSDVEPGSTHDMTCAHQHALPALYAAAAQGLPTLADSGYQGAGIGVHTPVKQPAGSQQLDPDNRTDNTLLRSLCGLGERGFALLTQRWRTLQHLTTSPRKIGTIVAAARTLTHYEHGMI